MAACSSIARVALLSAAVLATTLHPRAAELAGMAVVLTEHWQLGAFVPSVEMGEKVANLIREKVKGQKPQVVCMKPRVRVEIPINLETGELKR